MDNGTWKDEIFIILPKLAFFINLDDALEKMNGGKAMVGFMCADVPINPTNQLKRQWCLNKLCLQQDRFPFVFEF